MWNFSVFNFPVLIAEVWNWDFEALDIILETAAAAADALQMPNKLIFKFSSA